MRIGIDARLYGTKHTGIGRYTQNLIHHLAKIDKKNTYLIFGHQDIKKEISSYKNFHYKKLTTKIYSFSEQIINPIVFKKHKLDLLHVPHFNAPLLYPGRLILTIHDLIKHISVGKETTTLPVYKYWLKYLAYRLLIRLNLFKAKAIITPTFYWKNYLISHYQINPQKIHVTYEAADKKIKPDPKLKPNKILKKYQLTKPFLVYTGNPYPHKNVAFLIQAIKLFNHSHQHKLTLALICSRTIFNQKYPASTFIKPLGYIPDQELALLYSQAIALVQPSLIEGFGLTGLEAMALNLPVLSSNATCLPEVYDQAALYFNPHDIHDLVLKIEQILKDKTLAQKLIQKGQTRVKQFSWYKTAKQTLKAYTKAANTKSNILQKLNLKTAL